MANKINAPVGLPFNLLEHVDYSGGSVVSRTLIDKKIGNITLFSFDMGQGLSEHTSPYDAVVHVIDGSAEITINKDTSTVRAGEMIIMPSNIPHSLHAAERFKMLLIMIREKSGSAE